MLKGLARKYLELQKARYLKDKGKTKRCLDLESPSRFLCLQMNAIGDAIMTQPAWAHLKSVFPGASIDLICPPHVAPLFKDDPDINVVFPFQARVYRSWLFQDKPRLNGIIDQGNYDLLIDFSALPLTAALCGSDSAPISLGFQRWIDSPLGMIDLGQGYDMSFPYSESRSIRSLMAQLVSPWVVIEDNKRAPLLEIGKGAMQRARDLVRKHDLKEGKFIVIHPGAKWPPKRWPISYWRKLITLLKGATSLDLLIMGGEKDERLIPRIQGEAGDLGVRNLISREIHLSSAIIKMAHLCVCNDSAAMHIAAAVGTRSVSLFGPVSPDRSAPSEGEHCHVFYDNMFCSPCTLYYSRNRCRRGLNFCMYAIKPEAVYRKIQEIISE